MGGHGFRQSVCPLDALPRTATIRSPRENNFSQTQQEPPVQAAPVTQLAAERAFTSALPRRRPPLLGPHSGVAWMIGPAFPPTLRIRSPARVLDPQNEHRPENLARKGRERLSRSWGSSSISDPGRSPDRAAPRLLPTSSLGSMPQSLGSVAARSSLASFLRPRDSSIRSEASEAVNGITGIGSPS